MVRVDKINNTLPLNESFGDEDFKTFVREYLQYKRGYEPKFDDFFEPVTASAKWPFINEQAVLVNIKRQEAYSSGYFTRIDVELQQRLEIVEIYFTAPTFDMVTKDARTDLVTKISLIGGMLGLFTGFSFISGVEIIYFTSKFFLKIYKK